jgi:hypothetical protein
MLNPRFSSLTYARNETRRTLRARLTANLPSMKGTAPRFDKKVMLDDVALLRLLTSLRTEEGNDIEKTRAFFEGAKDPAPGSLSLQDLLDAGWLRSVFRRVSTTIELMRAAKLGPLQNNAALSAWLKDRYVTKIEIPDELDHDEDLSSAVGPLRNGDLALRDIGCRSPEWVAARLWEGLLKGSPDGPTALRKWMDRWTDLDHPSLVPSVVWDQETAQAFRDAALQVLEFESGFVGWTGVRGQFARELALAQQVELPPNEEVLPPVPNTLVGRILWLHSPQCTHAFTSALRAGAGIIGLAGLLFADVQAADTGAAPHDLFRKVVALAVERPELLYLVDRYIRHSPVLLADMLLLGSTSAAASLIVSQWQGQGGAWDRNLTDRDNEAAKLTAFNDAISVTCYLLQNEEVSPAEVASLISWLHTRGQTSNPGDSGTMLQNLRSALREQPLIILQSMAGGLINTLPSTGLGSPEFAAALDVIHAGQLADLIEPEPLVTSYVHSVAKGDYTLSAHRITIGGAAALFHLAMRTGTETRQRFFYPIDVPARLAERNAPGANPFTVAEEIARSLRTHIRVLCRVVIGQIQDTPEVLIDALVLAIKSGAIARAEKAQVDAFSAQYETSPVFKSLDRPISADLGGALSTLTGTARTDLLEGILKTEEPLILAKLLEFAPPEVRPQIEERISALPPSEAGDVYTLIAIQARIEELLNAGALDIAAQFLELERNSKTLGKVPGRELIRLKNVLRLHFLRKEWREIEAIEFPKTSLSGSARRPKRQFAFSMQSPLFTSREAIARQQRKHSPD